MSKYDETTQNELEQETKNLLTADNDKLGRIIREYLTGSVYDTFWEGFTEPEQKTVLRLLQDINLAAKHGLGSEAEQPMGESE